MNRLSKNLGMLLLCIWLITYGVMQFVVIAHSALILGILAIAAGILILLQR